MRSWIICLLLVTGLSSAKLLADPRYPVTFSIKAPSAASSVALVGDFNSWSASLNPLHYVIDTDSWETTIELEPGQYEYRFLINGVNWIKDPENPHWGGMNSNSIAYVLHPGQPRLVDISPETGIIINTDIVRLQANFVDGIEKNGISIEESRVQVDGRDIEYHYVPEKNEIRAFSPRLKEGEHDIKIEAVDTKGNKALPVKSNILVNNHNVTPIADAGYTIITGVNEQVSLNSGASYDDDLEPIVRYRWSLLSRPERSDASLDNNRRAYPSFIPDKTGRYVFSLEVNDIAGESSSDTVDVYAFVRRKYPTEFVFADTNFVRVYESDVDCVSVAGEFNQWSTVAHQMKDYNHDGVWTAWVDLDPGEYEYKFVVNNQHWIIDPLNPNKIADGWNAFNSVKRVTLNLAPRIAVEPSFRPGAILMDASASESVTGKDLKYYWYQDINNPERYELNDEAKIKIPIPTTSGVYYYYLVVSDSFGSGSQETLVLKVKNRKVQIQNFSASPDWARDAIIYEIFVEKFTSQGNLRGVIDKIPYLKELGINCIWLMPVFESPTENGYGPTDFFRIDHQYGNEDDLKELVTSAHQAGIRVVLDFIANHTSDQHRFFVSSFENRYAVFRDWYKWKDSEQERLFYRYEFYNDWDRLPNLNHANPQVRKYLMDVALYWLNSGIDGYRCDVAWGVPHDFWKIFRRTLKNQNPDFLLLNETLPRNPLYHDNEFDMSYDTDFYGNLLDVFRGRKPISAIQTGIDKTNLNYPDQALSLRYIENHDMERFISQFDINTTKLAATLIFTLPGTPLMLYGQEFGMTDRLPTMDWGYSEQSLYTFYHKLILLRRHHSCLRRGELIKITTDHEDKLYAYARQSENERFLVLMNLSQETLDCQLYLKSSFPELRGRIYAEEMLSGRKMALTISENSILTYKIESETSVIIKL
ncbi:hypothetical protein JXB12_09880 [candidate division KSB1 bacterium]|nr:hypothetical protein [candidate division KSB1 bacterium]